jgi:hypothetical protein
LSFDALSSRLTSFDPPSGPQIEKLNFDAPSGSVSLDIDRPAQNRDVGCFMFN